MPNSNDQNNGFTSRFYMTTPVDEGEPIVQRYDIEALRLVDSESRNPVNIGDSTHPVYFLEGKPQQCAGGGSGGGGGSDVTILPKYKGGTLLANFSIDGQNGRIYSPSVAEVYKKATLWPPAGTSGVYVSEVGDNNNNAPFKTMINNYEFLLIHYAPTNALSEERTMMLDAQSLKSSLPDNAIFSCHYLSDVFIKCKFTSQDKFEVIESEGIPLNNEEEPQMIKCAIKKIEGLQFGASGENLDQGLTVKQVLWDGVADTVNYTAKFKTGTVESFNYIYLHFYATNNQYEERILVIDQEAIINGLAKDPSEAYFTCDISDDLYIKGKFVAVDEFTITEVQSKTIEGVVVKPVLSQIDGICMGSVGAITTEGGDTSDCMKKGIDYVTAGLITEGVLGVKATAEGCDTDAVGKYSHAEGFQSYAFGENSHAENSSYTGVRIDGSPINENDGDDIYKTGKNAHAEGLAIAAGEASHAEGGANGYITTPYIYGFHGNYWHDYHEYPDDGGASVVNTISIGTCSHAEGFKCLAEGIGSHAEGGGTLAYGDFQHVEGFNNVIDDSGIYAHIIGNGRPDTTYVGAAGGVECYVPKNIFTIDWEGNVSCKALTQTSSRKVKENIKDMSKEEAEKLLQLRPVSFDYIKNEGDKNCYGLIAEEVQDIGIEYPVFNGTMKTSSEECLQLDYSKFIPYLIKMIQIQEERINNLEKELERKGVK